MKDFSLNTQNISAVESFSRENQRWNSAVRRWFGCSEKNRFQRWSALFRDFQGIYSAESEVKPSETSTRDCLIILQWFQFSNQLSFLSLLHLFLSFLISAIYLRSLSQKLNRKCRISLVFVAGEKTSLRLDTDKTSKCCLKLLWQKHTHSSTIDRGSKYDQMRLCEKFLFIIIIADIV